jgi:DNA-binding response OmpR family regulator
MILYNSLNSNFEIKLPKTNHSHYKIQDIGKSIKNMKLLLIEDEIELAQSIINLLKKEAYRVEWVENYSDAESKIEQFTYDCVLVDITLPDGNGLDIVRLLKKRNVNSGVIIITAKNSLKDRIEGLDIGADDYISKPFHLAELNSRVKALLRRRISSGNKEIELQNIRIIPESFQVFVNDAEIELTRKEFNLLLFLASNKNRVITKESIAEHIWGDYIDLADSYNFIYTHVKNLRKKILDKGGSDFIQSVYGIGYKFSTN